MFILKTLLLLNKKITLKYLKLSKKKKDKNKSSVIKKPT